MNAAAALAIMSIGCALLAAGLAVLVAVLVRGRRQVKGRRFREDLARRITEAFIAEPGNQAYAAIAGLLGRLFGCRHVVFGWIDTWNTLAWLHPGEERMHQLPREQWDGDWQAIFRHGVVVATGRGACPVDGETWAHGAVMPVTLRAEPLALVLLGRNERPFSREELDSLDRVMDGLVPIIYYRVQASRQEAVRRMTETAFRASEARLRTILDETRDMVLTVNGTGQVSYINPAGAAMLGYPDAGGLFGRPARELWLLPADYCFFDQRIREERYIQDMEILLRDSAGGSHFCLASATASQTGGGDFAEFTALVKDISDLIAGQKALTKANIELEEVNQRLRQTQALMVQREKMASIGRLAAGLAREINSPLSFVKGNNVVMARHVAAVAAFLAWLPGKNPESVRTWVEANRLDFVVADMGDVLRESEDGCRRVMDIVQGLRSFSRDEGAAERELFDLNQGIQATLVAARNEIRSVIRIEQCLAALPLVFCKGNEINQVILNLLVNAAQAISELPEGRDDGRITIRSWADDGQVHCAIADNGIGIPGEHLGRVFDPFFTTKPTGQGAGLGLSISYDIIVNRHGGRLAVESSPGQGAEFSFSLPIAENAAMR